VPTLVKSIPVQSGYQDQCISYPSVVFELAFHLLSVKQYTVYLLSFLWTTVFLGTRNFEPSHGIGPFLWNLYIFR